MCGIVGLYSISDEKVLNIKLNEAMKSLHHRGPDDKGEKQFKINNNLFKLGHTRLSIIDLSQAGKQPMQTQDKRYTIIFNGEIYNYKELRTELKSLGHKFITSSDTEVLLIAWVQWQFESLKKFKGMFSFAIFDKKKNELFLARDAFGIKPLFFGIDNEETLFFGSELPALVKIVSSKTGLNYQKAYDYLTWNQYDNGSSTFYNSINQLPRGHYAAINLNDFSFKQKDIKPIRWWWPSIKERKDLKFNDAAEQLRELFLKNVRLHLRSDVPVGAALSGGLDSSAVVCAMRILEPDMPIHTFSYIAKGTELDEEEWVDIVNNHVKAIPHKIVVTADELAKDLDEMIIAQGEPFMSTSIYAQYRVFKAAKDEGIIVTLDGQGADELLAGYNGFPNHYINSLIDNHNYGSIIPFLNSWSKWPNRGIKKSLLMLGAALTPEYLTTFARKLIGQNPAPDWIKKEWLQNEGARVKFPKKSEKSFEGRGRRLVEHLREILTGDGFGLSALLRHADRNSMHWSIESRVPFLTTEMAEFLLTLPETYLLSNNGETKHIFRAAMKDIVPDSILKRKDKIGFKTPQTAWLIQNKNIINKWLLSAKELPFIDESKCDIETLINQKNFNKGAWNLINYCRWTQL
jgi:asparagine synthase (glutamine-hydrolysing)